MMTMHRTVPVLVRVSPSNGLHASHYLPVQHTPTAWAWENDIRRGTTLHALSALLTASPKGKEGE
jgi:hypothetical protein